MLNMFTKKKPNSGTTVITEPEKIQNFMNRGIEKIYPNDEFLEKRLASGEKLSMYLGIDPTGPTLHLGHSIALKKMAEFQKLGHKAILLIGDFTAQIGDPDKTSVRKQLTHAEVLENAKLYKEQASLFLDFGGSNPAELRYNSEWSNPMKFADVLNLASKMTVQQMLERDMFRKRLSENKPIYLHEFMYPLMQGYDAVAMDVDGEIGGNDQTFNMLVGRTLMKDMSNKEKFVLPVKLLTDTSGAKMGKTTNNMLSFLDSAQDKFGKIMSWPDGMIMSGFELLTDVNLRDVEQRLASGENPRDIKMDLAMNVTEFYHSKDEADKAKQAFITQFSKQEIPEDIPEVVINEELGIIEVLKQTGLAKSNNEAKRKIQEGAVVLDGNKIKSITFKMSGGKPQKGDTVILKLGRKIIKLKFK